MRSLAIPLQCVVALAAEFDQTPPQVYTLEIDGARHEVVGGRAYEFEIHGKKTSVRLTPRPFHEVETEWFTLRFPTGYRFEYDDGLDMELPPDWTLDGDACFIKLIATMKDSERAKVAFWERLLHSADEKLARSDVTLRIAGLELKGVRIDDTTDPDIPFATWLYSFSHAGKAWILHIHDAPEVDGSLSKELKPLYEMFCRTLRLTS